MENQNYTSLYISEKIEQSIMSRKLVNIKTSSFSLKGFILGYHYDIVLDKCYCEIWVKEANKEIQLSKKNYLLLESSRIWFILNESDEQISESALRYNDL